MRRIPCLVILSGLFVSLNAQTPAFFGPESLKANGINIDVTYYGSPFVYDWDGDGSKDLITGQFSSGLVRFYKNQGPNNSPSFTDFSYLQADGTNISVYAS